MYRIQLTCALALALMLGACAAPLLPGNYADRISTTWLGADRFVVSYRGNPDSTDEQVVDLALLRSAEIVLQNGFNYFIVVDGDEAASVADAGLPAAAMEFTVSEGRRYRPVSPGASNTIVAFRQRPQGFAYVALFVKASLGARYGLDQAGTAI